MMDNMAKSDKISFVSLSDVPIKDYFDVDNIDCNVDTMTIPAPLGARSYP
jgi:hypothetical protein